MKYLSAVFVIVGMIFYINWALGQWAIEQEKWVKQNECIGEHVALGIERNRIKRLGDGCYIIVKSDR